MATASLAIFRSERLLARLQRHSVDAEARLLGAATSAAAGAAGAGPPACSGGGRSSSSRRPSWQAETAAALAAATCSQQPSPPGPALLAATASRSPAAALPAVQRHCSPATGAASPATSPVAANAAAPSAFDRRRRSPSAASPLHASCAAAAVGPCQSIPRTAAAGGSMMSLQQPSTSAAAVAAPATNRCQGNSGAGLSPVAAHRRGSLIPVPAPSTAPSAASRRPSVAAGSRIPGPPVLQSDGAAAAHALPAQPAAVLPGTEEMQAGQAEACTPNGGNDQSAGQGWDGPLETCCLGLPARRSLRYPSFGQPSPRAVGAWKVGLRLGGGGAAWPTLHL